MRLVNVSLLAIPPSKIDIPQDMSAGFLLPAMYLGNIVNYSIQLVFVGVPVGTFKLQCSNDAGEIMAPGRITQDSKVINWTDITESFQTITDEGNHAWNVENIGYLWIRAAFVASPASTGTLTVARITAKGA